MENANRISILSVFALLVVGMTFFVHARDDMPPIDSSLGVTFQNGYQGDAKAQYQIGMHYLNGVDSGSAYLEQNSEQARAWLSQSAHNGMRTLSFNSVCFTLLVRVVSKMPQWQSVGSARLQIKIIHKHWTCFTGCLKALIN